LCFVEAFVVRIAQPSDEHREFRIAEPVPQSRADALTVLLVPSSLGGRAAMRSLV
jgi:hypothetical protein